MYASEKVLKHVQASFGRLRLALVALGAGSAGSELGTQAAQRWCRRRSVRHFAAPGDSCAGDLAAVDAALGALCEAALALRLQQRCACLAGRYGLVAPLRACMLPGRSFVSGSGAQHKWCLPRNARTALCTAKLKHFCYPSCVLCVSLDACYLLLSAQQREIKWPSRTRQAAPGHGSCGRAGCAASAPTRAWGLPRIERRVAGWHCRPGARLHLPGLSGGPAEGAARNWQAAAACRAARTGVAAGLGGRPA